LFAQFEATIDRITREINGQMYPLKNGAFNPLSLAKVDGGV
jgi:hypothetical protein